MQVLVAKEAEEIAAGLGELTADLAESRGRSFEADAATRAAYWDALVAGEWPLVGAEPEADGGLSDLDLCHVAEQWAGSRSRSRSCRPCWPGGGGSPTRPPARR